MDPIIPPSELQHLLSTVHEAPDECLIQGRPLIATVLAAVVAEGKVRGLWEE